ncbi:hypothetical protein BHE74_00005427 [Ensete ventricosum]|uniref:DUF7722 domain-containing protein n=1 Tax=Ensete ventricosum TaxID=4639 RepID=A0A427AVV6_ENSVE|nr:hypothetical protein B296_00005423 [Ensete ventricosum]RWW25962.1 hypothetical protein GW17_00009672 [Ensete ventricosum]RWW85865.1 hypothetical protein BHE74_00005427 [Ensete ventricosum]RZR78126.1 hypothetical protein BHM03_00003366 [Ensete ventricosum]
MSSPTRKPSCSEVAGKPWAAFRRQWHDGEEAFKMPLHYPRYTKAQYEAMEEAQLDFLLKEYGLPCRGDVAEKRKDAMGHFLWSQD